MEMVDTVMTLKEKTQQSLDSLSVRNPLHEEQEMREVMEKAVQMFQPLKQYMRSEQVVSRMLAPKGKSTVKGASLVQSSTSTKQGTVKKAQPSAQSTIKKQGKRK